MSQVSILVGQHLRRRGKLSPWRWWTLVDTFFLNGHFLTARWLTWFFTWCLVGGLEPELYFSIYWELLGMIPPNWLVFFKGVETTNQMWLTQLAVGNDQVSGWWGFRRQSLVDQEEIGHDPWVTKGSTGYSMLFWCEHLLQNLWNFNPIPISNTTVNLKMYRANTKPWVFWGI